MADIQPVPDASPAVPEAIELPRNADDASRKLLAWLEIESLTFGEFKQVVRVPFYAGQIITIGRDARKCNLRLKNKAVSHVHCEIYSIQFDKDELYPTLVYVRDCQSASGTFVNGDLVGKEPFVAAARLLENNDTISVGPCSLRLCGYNSAPTASLLPPLQRAEASLFADQFLVKDMILGSGAFASVYLAVDVKTKKQVICKVHDLASLQRRDPSAVERVDREMSIWSQLDHVSHTPTPLTTLFCGFSLSDAWQPNIIAFRRAFRTSNSMFTIADLAAGGDLVSLLRREQTIPELEIKWIVFQVLRAVDYLHCKGVAHRDIKPENVLCSSSFHMHHRIALTDFGCAGVASLGRLTSHVGTHIYRAPEAQRAAQPHGVAVDIWSIGVLALQLLSGNDTVEEISPSCTEQDIENMVVLANLRRAGQHHGPISQNGVDFMLACLHPQPLARPSATQAAKHVWFRESAHQILQFKEREKQLAWKPRDIIFPAVVPLPDCQPGLLPADRSSSEREARDGPSSAPGVFESVPDSTQPSPESTPDCE